MLSCVFFFKQKTAYEMRISDWSSDVCSSDLPISLRSGYGSSTALPMKSATQNVILEADYPAHSDRAKRSLQQPESAQRHELADQQQGSAGPLSDEYQRGLQETLLAQQHSRRKRQKDAQRSANSTQHRIARAHGNGRDDA